MSRRVRIFALTLATTLALPAAALAVEPIARDHYLALGTGVGMYAFSPTIRVYGRASAGEASFDVRAGVFTPEFTDQFVWEAAAGPRLRIFRREPIDLFVAWRVGFWDYEVGINPMTSAVVGAEVPRGRSIFSFEVGGGAIGGADFDAVEALVEVNAYAGLMF